MAAEPNDIQRKRIGDLARSLGPDILFPNRFVPVSLTGDTLHVWALRDDDDYKLVIATLAHKTRVTVEKRSEDEIVGILRELFPAMPSDFVGIAPEVEQTVNALLDEIIERALDDNATDIHLQYADFGLAGGLHGEVLFRVDRSLTEIESYRRSAADMRLLMNVLSHRANAPESEPLAVRSIQHSGAQKRSVDIRVQFLEDKHGRTAVMRLNGNAMRLFTLDELNMLRSVVVEVKRSLQGAAGLHLLIGPQGVGKTTTLAAMIEFVIQVRRQRGERVKIVTAEKPIDIRIDGVTQIDIREERNMSFAQATRAFAKADPDFMVVGEINDRESLDAVLYATLLGRPCGGSLHASNALSSFERLRLLGADISTLSHVLRTLLAQRMLRRLCPTCKALRLLTAEEKELFQLWDYKVHTDEDVPKQIADRGAGCTMCNYRGYFGVFPVFELVVVTPKLIDAVRGEATLAELEQVAIAQRRHFLPMSAFALIAAAGGHVSLNDAREAIFER
jgi:type II secretory ATPase GspE/PulE/Tfp pilus assembly ATPase PilB-like protein